MIEGIASLGPVMQLAYVPRDVTAALRYWTGVIGAGPFFSFPHIGYEAARYRGNPSQVDFSVLIGYWDDLQIELIEQHCESPSIYKAWRDEGREGLHHVCVLVESITRAREVCARSRGRIEQEVFLEGAEAIYVDAGGGPGTLMEFVQPSRDLSNLFATMRDAARDWDGRDPLRTLD